MKKSLVTMLLVFAAAALVQQSAAQGAAQPAQAGQPAQAAQKKEIKDPAEYNAYVNAIQQTSPQAKAQGLEAFLQTYPNSVMKEDALEQLMVAYQQAGDVQKTIDTANRVLQVNPNNTGALALLAYYHRALASQGGQRCDAEPRFGAASTANRDSRHCQRYDQTRRHERRRFHQAPQRDGR